MDHKDRQIIRELQRNGRMTNQDLAAAVNLSPSPCLRRLRNLEESGAIQGYSADVDTKAYGLPVRVFVRVTLEQHSEAVVRNFEDKISRVDEVLECYIITGTSDYQLLVVVADLDGYEYFVRKRLQTIGGISSIDTSFVYSVVKRTTVLPVIG